MTITAARLHFGFARAPNCSQNRNRLLSQEIRSGDRNKQKQVRENRPCEERCQHANSKQDWQCLALLSAETTQEIKDRHCSFSFLSLSLVRILSLFSLSLSFPYLSLTLPIFISPSSSLSDWSIYHSWTHKCAWQWFSADTGHWYVYIQYMAKWLVFHYSALWHISITSLIVYFDKNLSLFAKFKFE